MQGRLVSTLTIGNPAPTKRSLRDGSDSRSKQIAMSAGYAGTISSGSVTAAGHNITTGLKVAVFWAVAGVLYCRYNITAGTVAGDVIPIGSGGGSGDALPSTGDVVICKATIVSTFVLTGSQMLQFLTSCDQRGLLQFFSDAGTTSIFVANAKAAGEGVSWDLDGTIAVPFSAAIAQVNAYNGSTKAGTWTITALLT